MAPFVAADESTLSVPNGDAMERLNADEQLLAACERATRVGWAAGLGNAGDSGLGLRWPFGLAYNARCVGRARVRLAKWTRGRRVEKIIAVRR
jgi:hypothetical protein